jgi:hypothetical protein
MEWKLRSFAETFPQQRDEHAGRKSHA